MQENEQKRDRIFRLIAIILLIIIIILLFFSRFGRINNYPMPTGNVDVFDIDVDVGYADVIDKKDRFETSDNNYDIGKKITSYNSITDKNTLGRVFVDDKNGNYIYQQNLNIFNNAAFQYTNKIAPGVSNTYHFVVHNSSNMNLKYYIEMYEDSEYKVNLKYRLKRKNSYVIGDDQTWVTAQELKTAFENIADSSSDSYSLDWKWFDDDNLSDTIAGENMKSLYKLNVRFYFEAVGA